MNCKPGDLAVIVHTMGWPEFNDLIGHIVKVIKLEGVEWYGPSWTVDSSKIEWAADACLRPLRDPGDDATDETLLWKPVPQEVTQ